MTLIMNFASTLPSLRPALLPLLLAVAAAPASAQVFRPGSSLSASWSYSGEAGLSRGSELGEFSAQYHEIDYTFCAPAGRSVKLLAGVSWRATDLDTDGDLPVPDTMRELLLKLGAQYAFNSEWSAFVQANPGWRAAADDLGGDLTDGDAFTVPVLVGATWTQSPAFTWTFGAAYSEFSQYQVLPYVGLNWRFAPKWSLGIGYPQLGLTYAASDALTLRAGLAGKGGSLRMVGSSLSGSPSAAYTGELVDYREIRAGVGADWTLAKGFRVVLDAGAVTDRKFEYHELDHVYNGDASLFVSLAAHWRF